MIVRCTARDCLNNSEGICICESIDLDNTNDIFECFNMETQKDKAVVVELFKRWNN